MSVPCIQCGYDLSGTALGSNCPECGVSVSETFGQQKHPPPVVYSIIRSGFVAAALSTGALQIWFEYTYGRTSPSRQLAWIGWYYSFQPLIIQRASAVFAFGVVFLCVSRLARKSAVVLVCMAVLMAGAALDILHRDSWLMGIWYDFFVY